MALKADEVYQAGLALDLDERTVVAHRLLASLHPEDDASQSEIDDAWRDEIGSRVDDILNDRVELGTFEQTRDKARALLDDLRK
ncbi:addiction module protein [Arthrobacter russicus]|uniref:addiction module protein n=1 Tax=Arthrobacter russicus TaxID=172040 RepID=UPI003CF3879E